MSGRQPCPVLSVHPTRALVDEGFAVMVEMLPPGFAVTLRALIHSEDNDFWEAYGHYVSDDTGCVKAAEHSSLGGSYDGVEPMGLLWSMKPVPGSRTGLRLRKKDVRTPLNVQILLYKGHMSDGFQDGNVLASVAVERWYLAPGVRRICTAENGLNGTLFLPPGPGPFPAVLDLWGGGGGLVEYRSALLASHGYASLSLEYMNPRIIGGTTQFVGNDYFEAAFNMLKDHPLVCAERIAVMGLSFGASVALGLTVNSPVVEPRCLVCVSASHIGPVKGSLSDVFAEISKNSNNTRYDEENRVIWRDLLLPIPDDPSKKTDVGRLKCPLLLIVGEDDQNWPASESAEDIKQMMERAGNSHLLTVLSYPDTGHLIEPPYSPHTRSSNFMSQQRAKVIVLWGGHTVPHSKAQEDAWEKTLAFLQEHLYGTSLGAAS
ncbi:acyl-CoA thioesterase 19 isoform X2 [Denticeps clupeoides]|uniref:Uncharacterized protein n=1 Tax=Denticeps clupeoides TaxID=299321 RepID=A0AAY4CKG5_9TELE|nr:acyl-coenzyme A thioesterase 1-like isoform X2 [Denticeps clupeoides]